MMVVCGAGVARAFQGDAYTPVVESFTTISFQGGGVVGVSYQATQDVTFNSLGVIDLNDNPTVYQTDLFSDGIHGSYQVGIWLNSTQTLLASTTVTPSSPLGLNSNFRYAPIPATTIPAGQSFTIGVLLPANPLDGYLQDYVSSNSSGISGPGAEAFTAGDTLTFPALQTTPGGPGGGIANASTNVVAPEPTATTCLFLALGGLAMLRHRRRATV